MKKALALSVIVLTMGAGMASGAGQLGGVVNATKKAGEATKEGAKTVGNATEDAAKKGVDVTKKGVDATKKAVTAQAKCVDGTHQTAMTQKEANAGCAKHGGVARK